MSSEDSQLWLQSWREQHTDFHQPEVNPLLVRFWPGLHLSPGSRVFVPLCGKSLDMLWLAQQGHQVIGVELSPIAVADFFRENHLQPVKSRQGQFTLWQVGRISILCGDYFALQAEDIGVIHSVYDRAALTALPEMTRKLYVRQLRQLVAASSQIFLLTMEDAEESESLKQALGVGAEIRSLYTREYNIELLNVESVYENDPLSPMLAQIRVEYKVYRLVSRMA